VIDRPPSAAYFRLHLRALIPYLVAASAYIALGVWEPRFLLSWVEGIVFVFIAVWALPALLRRLRR
jgi:hypothetical protein